MIMKSLLAARFSHLLKQTSRSSVTKLTMTDLEVAEAITNPDKSPTHFKILISGQNAAA
jgi:hypothetical protein